MERINRANAGGRRIVMTLSARFLPLCFLLAAVRAPAGDTGLRLVQTIPLPEVEGRIDHMAADVEGGRLFVAALGNNTLEVLDLREGTHIRSIAGLHQPQGVVFVAGSNRLFVANGQDGALSIYDAGTYQALGSVSLSDDADNLRYDAETDRIYVGYGNGALGAVEAAAGKKVGSTRLGGHPESFQLEQDGRRIFINVPSKGHIAVVDRDSKRVVSVWPLAGAQANFPMALDAADHRLFVGCRRPARLLVYDTESGHQIGSLAIDGDPDDVFYNAAHKSLYVSCGAGYLDLIEQTDADSYVVNVRLPTAPGARASLYVPELGRLYLAVPHRGGHSAEIRVYAPVP
jgi:DNA-binding beta-propeller fold protein YncE